jgi:hypothetical protein
LQGARGGEQQRDRLRNDGVDGGVRHVSLADPGTAVIYVSFNTESRGHKTGIFAFAAWGARKKGTGMARKYSKSASKDVESAMDKRKKGTLRSGKGGKGGKVTSRKQAIAIGLSEARAEGKKVPKKKKSAKKAPAKHKTAKRKTAKRKTAS